MGQSEGRQAAWALCQEVPVSEDLILATGQAAWGGGVAYLVGVQAALVPTLGLQARQISGSRGLTSWYDRSGASLQSPMLDPGTPPLPGGGGGTGNGGHACGRFPTEERRAGERSAAGHHCP